MSKQEELKANSGLKGVLPDYLVTFVSINWFGSNALEPTCKTLDGNLCNTILYGAHEARIDIVTPEKS